MTSCPRCGSPAERLLTIRVPVTDPPAAPRDDPATPPSPAPKVPGGERTEWHRLRALVPADVWRLFTDAVEALEAAGAEFNRNPEIAAGQAVEMLAAEYLATPR